MARAGAGACDLTHAAGGESARRCLARSLRSADAQPMSASPLLEVHGLTVTISRHGKAVRNVVEDVSFDLPAGEILALVGESGSGKTMIGRSILSLLPPAAAI